MSTFTLAGHRVGRVGYGAMQLPGPGVFGPPRDHDEAVRVLRHVVELGIDHIDTSQFYGPNVSNELIKEALHPYADDLVIVSKVGAVRGPSGEWLPAQRPDQLVAAVRENLVTLDVERLPVVNLRVMPVDEIGEENACPLEEQLGAMQGLVEAGEEQDTPTFPLYEFVPDADAVIEELLPRYIRSRITNILLQAMASEHASTQRAMKTATDNAQTQIDKFTRLANSARQAEITQEITEIVSGADALGSE